MKNLLKVSAATLAIGLFVLAQLGQEAYAEDPFAEGADALAVADDDGSTSLRAKLALKKMAANMVMVKVVGINDKDFPNCVLSAKVIKTATSKDGVFKLLGKNKTYRFAPVLKMKGKTLDLKNQLNQNNLGACYYPKKTKLIIEVAGVDMKKKAFKAAAIYLK
jgi:hypothetical protein